MAMHQRNVNISVVTCNKQSPRILDDADPPSVLHDAFTINGPDGRVAEVVVSDSVFESSLCTPSPSDSLLWIFQGHGPWVTAENFFLPDKVFAIAAFWPVTEGADDHFAEAAWLNAKASVEFEEGCLAFGVFRSPARPNMFALVEAFRCEEDFAFHLKTEHFHEFRAIARPLFIGNANQTVKGTLLRQ